MVSDATLEGMEQRYPGIRARILAFEAASLPPYIHCGSGDTAAVNVGVFGLTMYISGATTKFWLIANGPKPGAYFCLEA